VRQLYDLGWQGIGRNAGGSPSFLSPWAGSLLEVAAAARDPVLCPPPAKEAGVKHRLVIALALVGLLSAVLISQAGAATQTTNPVTTIADGSGVGSSTLTRTASRISFSLQTSGLEPGHAVTVWWMVANPDTSVSVLYAAGHVIDNSGTAEFGGALKVGDTKGVVSLPGLSTEGLLDAAAADVYLVVRDHGPAKRGLVHQQIHTFDVCNPTCTDLQMSVHLAG
jgi:hypothetical protein